MLKKLVQNKNEKEKKREEDFIRLGSLKLRETPTTTVTPENFPPQLGDLSNPPKQLYCQGMLDLAKITNAVAVVGTRQASEYGLKFARELGYFLASKDIPVISGLALGVDTAAHEGALEAKGPTVAVLGTGLDIVYPRENKKLFERMASQGLLITEFPLGQPPDKWTFPARNRIVAALARALVVVESDLEGGAMITADMAQKLGRRIFALPGRVDQPAARGPNKLIQQGATLINSPEEFFYFLNNPNLTVGTAVLPLRQSKKRKTQTRAFALPPELAILAEGQPMTLDELAERSGRPIGALMMLLLEQEMGGAVVKRLDGRYEAC